MEKETGTDKILRAIADVHARVDTIVGHMATKDDLTTTTAEMVSLIVGEFAKLRMEDIDPMKRDIRTTKNDVQKIRNTFAPRLEYNDRLQVIEQKLSIPSQK